MAFSILAIGTVGPRGVQVTWAATGAAERHRAPRANATAIRA